ncbi:hypothetical protein [Mucilaginibacter terrae]|uniref:HNH endonuclease 5 domain-containing protein n=1 Tax=Mucilaginibacter terrae TaxID=1955052 RepID=A0ABU3GNS3_9SPHI|nr:hypothetical protein [Mucilaginibacter terrae]MDT3401245.1 hypothetical protein [Mucilaginibacter terrae]
MAKLRKKDIEHFYRNYKLIGKAEKRIHAFTGTLSCRFCGKSSPEVIFKNDAHLVPELMGKNDFLYSEECDSCNSLFSKYESHLAIYLRPYLTMLGVKGKKKVPFFQSRSAADHTNGRTIITTGANNQKNIVLGSLDDYKIDHEKKVATFTFRNPPYIPLNVYKAFVKIGLSLLPNEKVAKYQNLCHWISDRPHGRLDYFPITIKTMMTESQFVEPRVELSESSRTIKENGFIPNLTLHLCFGNLIFQVYLPLAKRFNYHRLIVKKPIYILSHHIFQGIGDKETSRVVKAVQLGKSEPVQRDEQINFSFTSGDFNIGESQTSNPAK